MFRSAYLASPGCGSARGRKMYIDKLGARPLPSTLAQVSE